MALYFSVYQFFIFVMLVYLLVYIMFERTVFNERY